MVKKRKLSPQSVWDEGALQEALTLNNVKTSHITKIHRLLANKPQLHWSELPDLPIKAQEILQRDFAVLTSSLESCQTATEGDTTKLLIRLQDGLQVESVIMHYDTSARLPSGAAGAQHGHARATLCVSSQVGCQMGCTFCATGTMGLVGNLTSGEILEQLVHALQVTQIHNIVFMGMGEPMNNYDAVCSAARAMTDSKRFGLRRSAVTISTVGVIPRILSMPDDLPGLSLALSLHAPTQQLRETIVPSAKAYKLDKLMQAIASYQQRTQQKVFVEYVMLAGVNDQLEHAHQLGQLLQGRDVVLNLIPWNPVYSPGIAFQAPEARALQDFRNAVVGSSGIRVTIRQEKGSDISGACGQLVISSTACSPKAPRQLRDIEDAVRLSAIQAK